jgi:DNA-binding PadR family transcriptional regulator
MTSKERLILFLIFCNPGIRDIYTMIKVFDRADFPSRMDESLNSLLEQNLIHISENFKNETANKYEITNEGIKYLENTFNEEDIINYIKTMDNPEQLLFITQTYIDKRNGLRKKVG